MSGSFYYDLKARFYGVFFQLPWSFFVTLCVLFPIVYMADQSLRILLFELVIYWTALVALVWIGKDIYAQRFLFEFAINDHAIRVYKNRQEILTYDLDQIKSVKSIEKNSTISRCTSGGSGLILKFSDGLELPVLDQIKGYEKFSLIVNKCAVVV